MVVVSLAWELVLPASSAMSTIKITQVAPSSIACDKFTFRHFKIACDLEQLPQTTTPSVQHLSRHIDFGASRWGQSEN